MSVVHLFLNRLGGASPRFFSFPLIDSIYATNSNNKHTKTTIKVNSSNNKVSAVGSLLDTLASGASLFGLSPNPLIQLPCGNDLSMDYLFFYHVVPDIRV